MKRALLGSIVLCATTGCGVPQDLPATQITVDGVERTYHLFAPSAASDDPMPLLVAVHGGGGAEEAFPQQAAFQALAEREGFVLALPIANHLPDNEGEWQLNTTAQSRQDIDFVEAMLDDVAAIHAIDPKRVYATGYSLGSMFTYELACQASERFAAIASFAGTMPVSPAACAPEQQVGLMHIHGVDDGIIAYGNTWDWKDWDSVGTMHDVPGLVARWRDAYGCDQTSETSGAGSSHTVHSGCTQGVRVEHHRLDGQGHGWPDAIEGVSTHEVIWSFVSGFSKP